MRTSRSGFGSARRLLTADHDSYERTALLVRNSIASEPLLVNLLNEAAHEEPGLEAAKG